MAVVVGTSGWQYSSWREAFYPKGLSQNRWLDHYARHFDCVEVNNTFYRLPQVETFDAWERGSPDDFLFALKLSRYLTHIKRLKDPAEPVATFMDRARHLGGKCGPLLLQLPANFHADAGRLDGCLAQFPDDVRVAVELRHESWFCDSVRDVLTDHGAALCLTDRGEKLLEPHWRTAGFGYVRFHQGCGDPEPCYRPSALSGWLERIRDMWNSDEEVFVFFNNDARCCAVRDAGLLAEQAAAMGLSPTRAVSPTDVQTV